MTFNVYLSVKRQTSEGYSPSFRNPCKEPTMTTVLNLETLLLSPLFDGFEKANVSVYTDKKTVATITASTTTFSKVVDQVVTGEDGDVLTDGFFKVTKEDTGLVFEKVKKEKAKKEKAKPSASVKASRTSGCAFNPKLV